MASTGKCPKCEKIVTNVRIEDVPGFVGLQPRWRCVTYLCNHCSTILSVAIDPVALETKTIEIILEKLNNRKS